MDEAEWLASADAQAMLGLLRDRASERKLRLFACACCRALQDAITPEKLRETINTAEMYADGLVQGDERKKAWQWARKGSQESNELTWEVGGGWREAIHVHALATALAAVALELPGEVATAIPVNLPWGWQQSACFAPLAREVFGNPFRPYLFAPAWRVPAFSLAQAAYEERSLPDGTLDPVRLAILSDALEEAGADQALLNHLCGPGPHVRGCWALDLVLGKK